VLAPPVLDRRCHPVSFELLDGYTLDAAARSARREHTDRVMNRIIDSPRDSVMTWVTPVSVCSAA
jgi:hypothetical protein